MRITGRHGWYGNTTVAISGHGSGSNRRILQLFLAVVKDCRTQWCRQGYLKVMSIATTAATIALLGGAGAAAKATNVGAAASIGESIIDDKKIADMDLMKFKGVDNAVKMTIRLSIGYCVVLTIAFITCIIYQIWAGKSLQHEIVIDKNGRSIWGKWYACIKYEKVRIHKSCQTFVGKWYAFDENTYEKNIASALKSHW